MKNSRNIKAINPAGKYKSEIILYSLILSMIASATRKPKISVNSSKNILSIMYHWSVKIKLQHG